MDGATRGAQLRAHLGRLGTAHAAAQPALGDAPQQGDRWHLHFALEASIHGLAERLRREAGEQAITVMLVLGRLLLVHVPRKLAVQRRDDRVELIDAHAMRIGAHGTAPSVVAAASAWSLDFSRSLSRPARRGFWNGVAAAGRRARTQYFRARAMFQSTSLASMSAKAVPVASHPAPFPLGGSASGSTAPSNVSPFECRDRKCRYASRAAPTKRCACAAEEEVSISTSFSSSRERADAGALARPRA